jgi:mRNA interferase YafQ
LKKTAKSKRASLPRTSDYSKDFFKDWEKLSRSGRYDMNTLKEVMVLIIANDAPLPPEWKDHELTGDWDGFHECHVGGDFLLIYKLAKGSRFDTVVFTRAGTHSELFK